MGTPRSGTPNSALLNAGATDADWRDLDQLLSVAAVGAVEPHFYHYALLKNALVRYRALAARPDIDAIAAPPAGRRCIGVTLIRAHRLWAWSCSPWAI